MNRRDALQMFAAGGALAARPGVARAQVNRGLPPIKITDVKTILTQPGPDHLVIVKVLTSGIGCATHRERPLAVATAVNEYLKPFLIGKNPEDIEDIWQSAYVSSYFRSGGALWDIAGKRAGMPVYKMLACV